MPQGSGGRRGRVAARRISRREPGARCRCLLRHTRYEAVYKCRACCLAAWHSGPACSHKRAVSTAAAGLQYFASLRHELLGQLWRPPHLHLCPIDLRILVQAALQRAAQRVAAAEQRLRRRAPAAVAATSEARASETELAALQCCTARQHRGRASQQRADAEEECRHCESEVRCACCHHPVRHSTCLLSLCIQSVQSCDNTATRDTVTK
jgi:hypothetical protein